MTDFQNLLKCLGHLKERYPDCWKQVDQVRQKADWPNYCFLPIVKSHQIVNGGRYSKDNNEAADIYRLAALSAWRATQGIYRFDPNLYSELFEMEIGALPVEILRRIPEWCIYIELQDEEWARGVFVHLEYNAKTNTDELRFLFDTTFEGKEGADRLYPNFIYLTGSLQESLKQQRASIEDYQNRHGLESSTYNFKRVHRRLTGVVSLVLYLCSVNADMNRPPAAPKTKRTKSGTRLFPAGRPSVWEVGYRIGPILGAAREAERSDSANGEKQVRPHVRRAHHHKYWIGTGDDKELILKWLGPVYVNVKDPDDLVMTIRPLKEKQSLYVMPEIGKNE